MENNINEILKYRPVFESELNDISKDFVPYNESSFKKFKEKLLTEHNISVSTYLNCFAKINYAYFIGTLENPLEFYLLLKNTNVIVTAWTSYRQRDRYEEVNYLLENSLIDNYADRYLNKLKESFVKNVGSITLEQFLEVYYIFEEIKGCKVDTSKNKFYELIKFLSEVNVQTRNCDEMMNLINMKAELKSYVDSYKTEQSKKIVK